MTVLPPITVGSVFADRYRVTRVIKSGGMGAVYEAFDPESGEQRALKVMHPDLIGDAELRGRFEQEATVTAGIESDHIARTFDAGIDSTTKTPFIVMELLTGEELGYILKERGAVPPGEVLALLTQAAGALDKTHAAGIVHRDLKPENLYVVKDADGSPAIKILDFGVAKVLAEGTSKTTKALGTPLYMPVEQIQGSKRIGPHADRYALAHIAYAMLTGEPYWREEAREIGVIALCLRVATGLPELATVRAKRRRNVELPAAFDAWFKQATAVRADERYDSSSAMIDDLRRTLTGGVIVHGPPSTGRSEPYHTPLTLEGLGTEARRSSVTGAESLDYPAKAPRRRAALTFVVPVVAALGVIVVWLSQGTSAAPAASGTTAGTAGEAAPPAVPVTTDRAVEPVPSLVAAPDGAASASASPSAPISKRAAGPAAKPRTSALAASAAPPPQKKKGDQWSIY